jgi:peptidoglycan lytic transglycosylase
VPQPLRAAIRSGVALAGFLALSSECPAVAGAHNCAACSAKIVKHLTPAARHANHVTPHDPPHPRRADADDARSFTGLASYYAERQHLASERAYDPSALTAAHRTLPFGTRLRVSDPVSGRSVVVTINDRGPFVRGRVLDLSLAAARALDMTERGVLLLKAAAF